MPFLPSKLIWDIIYSTNPSLDIDIKMSKRWVSDELKIEGALCQDLDERPDWENMKNVFTDKFSLGLASFRLESFSHDLT